MIDAYRIEPITEPLRGTSGDLPAEVWRVFLAFEQMMREAKTELPAIQIGE